MSSMGDARRELERIRNLRNNMFSDSRRLMGEMAHAGPGSAVQQVPFSPLPTYGSGGCMGESGALPLYSTIGSATPTRSSPVRSPPFAHGSFARQQPQPELYSMHSPPSHPSMFHGPQATSSHSSYNIMGNMAPGPPGGLSGINGSGVSDGPTFGPGAAASVITAFRQLQAKARYAEQERAEAVRQREDLRRQIEANERTRAFWKSQSEVQANESFQNMRAATDQMVAAKRDMELQLMTSQDVAISTQRSNAHERALIVTLENDLSEIHAKLHVMKSASRSLEHELSATEGRCERVASTVEASPDARQKQVRRLEQAIKTCEGDIEAAERALSMTTARCDALQRYMEMILGINGDLSRRIMTTANTREHIRELAEKLTPPRYAWPKELPYDSILNAISDVAADSTHFDQRDHRALVTAAAQAVVRSSGSPPAAAFAKSMATEMEHRGKRSPVLAGAGSSSSGNGNSSRNGNGGGYAFPMGDNNAMGHGGSEGEPFFGRHHHRPVESLSAGAAILSEGGGARDTTTAPAADRDPVLSSLQASAADAMQASAAAIAASERQDKFDLEAAYRNLALDTMRYETGVVR